MNKKAYSTALVAGIFLLILAGMSLLSYLQYGATVLQTGLYLDVGIPQSIFWIASFGATIITAIGLLANKRLSVAGWVLRAIATALPVVVNLVVLVTRSSISRIAGFLLPQLPAILTTVAMILAASVCSRLMSGRKAGGAAMVIFAVLSLAVSVFRNIQAGMPTTYALQSILNATNILNLGVYILLALSGGKGNRQEQTPAFTAQPQEFAPKSQTPNLSGAELARAQEELAYYEGLVNKGILSPEDLAEKRRELGL